MVVRQPDEWVPELKGVDPVHLAQPELMPPMEQQWSDCVIGEDYPEPIVDHATAYESAQRTIRAVHELPESKRIAAEALDREASRRAAQHR